MVAVVEAGVAMAVVLGVAVVVASFCPGLPGTGTDRETDPGEAQGELAFAVHPED